MPPVLTDSFNVNDLTSVRNFNFPEISFLVSPLDLITSLTISFHLEGRIKLSTGQVILRNFQDKLGDFFDGH